MARSNRTGNSKSANNHKATPPQRSKQNRHTHAQKFSELLSWFKGDVPLFTKKDFHGNIKWSADELVSQAFIWAWQDTTNVTDAFDQTMEACERLKLKRVAQNYTSFMNALNKHRELLGCRLQKRFQTLAQQIGDEFWSHDDWVLLGIDGSRATTPRSVSNEQAFCAPNIGNSGKAKSRRKKAAAKIAAGQRTASKQPHPQVPQTWITMMWHMGLKLPWSWRLGPSNSCERQHAMEMITQEKSPKYALYCGDAGFVGYPLWECILNSGNHFLVRVGANVHLLSEQADILELGGGMVLCWPKGQMKSGGRPLRLRLVQVRISKKTKAWILTSVLQEKRLPSPKIVTYYKMRWGIEIEFRGLKQTLDKHTLRCRTSHRVLVELDWSIRAMAVAELMALAQQIKKSRKTKKEEIRYDPKHRSLANTIRAIRTCIRNLGHKCDGRNDLFEKLSAAKVQQYKNSTNKQARYCPANKDKKPLGDPHVRQMTDEEREKLRKTNDSLAA